MEWILAAGAEFDVDLIVMTTKGQDSVLDLLRGSTTERVLRGARCPLLAIPARSSEPCSPRLPGYGGDLSRSKRSLSSDWTTATTDGG